MSLTPEVVAVLLVIAVGVILVAQIDVPAISARPLATLGFVVAVGANVCLMTDPPSMSGWNPWEGSALGGALKINSGAETPAAGMNVVPARDDRLDDIGWQAESFLGVIGTKIEGDARTPNPRFSSLASTMSTTVQPEGKTRLKRFKDCSECPEMVFVEPGETLIGAEWNDTLAVAAEMPARAVRIRPGFALSRVEISLADLAEAGISLRATSECAMPELSPMTAAATCIGRREIAQYVRWLRVQTGKKYRLPTAAEWEFAARTAAQREGGPEAMSGGVAEVVLDCWRASLPDAVTARDTYNENGRDCANSVVKDGADDEDDRWKRPSARRSVGVDMASPRIGFRVLREVGPVETLQF